MLEGASKDAQSPSFTLSFFLFLKWKEDLVDLCNAAAALP